MEDNKFNGLDLPLEFLDLPDDEPLPLEEDAEFIIKPVAVLDVTKPAPMEGGEAPVASTTLVPDDNVVVYGLGNNRREESQNGRRRVPMALFSVLAATLVVAAIGVIMIPRILAAREPEPELVVVNPPEPVVIPEPKPVEPALGPDEIAEILPALKHKKTKVAIDSSQVTLSILDGRLIVTQTLPEGEEFDPAELVKLTSLRSNALAAALTGKRIAAKSDEKGTDFTDLTWIVRATDKKAYLAITELPGKVRSSNETYGVLTGSQGYALSDSLYEALGGTDTGILAGAGTAPTDLKSKTIKVTAAMPAPPEPEEPPAEEVAPAEETYVADDYSYDNTDYSYDDTTYEDTTSDYTYDEPVVDTTPSSPEPDAYVVPDEPEAYVVPEDPVEPADDGGEAGAEDTGE